MLSNRLAAEDVAQETFLRFWRAELRGQKEVQILAWLYRTSTRLARRATV